jgi:hypothetical protein
MLTLNTPSETLHEETDASAATRIAAALTAAGVNDRAIYGLLSEVTEDPATVEPLKALRARLDLSGAAAAPGEFERILLQRALQISAAQLDAYPVDASVKRLYRDEIDAVVSRTPAARSRFDLTKNIFVGLAKIATLRRFPAGQMTWEISGIPKSWLPKVPPRHIPSVLKYLLKLGGLGPAFVPHLNATRKDRGALLESETNKSWYRMAQSLKLQPRVRGLVASSWLHSPDTMRVSPHMIGFSRALLENGALLIRHHVADLDCGVFYRSPERKKLYERGEFIPTHGLVIWPRKEMIAWADAHPELADPTS